LGNYTKKNSTRTLYGDNLLIFFDHLEIKKLFVVGVKDVVFLTSAGLVALKDK
jgi:hypothetical protein